MKYSISTFWAYKYFTNSWIGQLMRFVTFLFLNSSKEIDYNLNLKSGISMFLKFRMESKLLCSATVVKIDMSAPKKEKQNQRQVFFFPWCSTDLHDGADILRNLFSLEFDFKILNNIIVILSKNVPSLDCRCCQRHFNVSNLYLMMTTKSSKLIQSTG